MCLHGILLCLSVCAHARRGILLMGLGIERLRKVLLNKGGGVGGGMGALAKVCNLCEDKDVILCA